MAPHLCSRRAIAVLTAAALVAGTATATAATRTDDGYTGQNVTVYLPDGTAKAAWAGAVHTRIDAGDLRNVLCVDLGHTYDIGTHPVNVVPQDMTAADNRAVGYILDTATPSRWVAPATGASAADAHRAEVAQIAVWVIVGDVRATNPTANAALNAEVAALVAEARAAAATPTAIALSAAAPAAGATQAVVTVTGKAGAAVDLTIPAGDGTLSAASVVLGSDGTARVNLTRLTPGTARVTAATAGDGRVMALVPTDYPQQKTVIAEPSTITAGISVAFTAAPVVIPNPSTGTTPVVTPPSNATPSGTTTPAPVATPAPQVAVLAQTAGAPRLALRKTGPARATAGAVVRYVITVTNRGTTEARNVTLTDRLPSGLTVERAAGARARSGAVRWNVGRLAPGASRRVVISVRTASTVSGRRVNVATATASGTRTVRATAATLFAGRRPAAVRPAVTG
ncbi:MAG: DUF11 domain-containing protein [Thermoleophilia bacterium]|nr:DUF11 domain-containing protein [Thermoleophilia bacterium]